MSERNGDDYYYYYYYYYHYYSFGGGCCKSANRPYNPLRSGTWPELCFLCMYYVFIFLITHSYCFHPVFQYFLRNVPRLSHLIPGLALRLWNSMPSAFGWCNVSSQVEGMARSLDGRLAELNYTGKGFPANMKWQPAIHENGCEWKLCWDVGLILFQNRNRLPNISFAAGCHAQFSHQCRAGSFIGFCRNRGPNIEYKQVHVGAKAGFIMMYVYLFMFVGTVLGVFSTGSPIPTVSSSQVSLEQHKAYEGGSTWSVIEKNGCHWVKGSVADWSKWIFESHDGIPECIHKFRHAGEYDFSFQKAPDSGIFWLPEYVGVTPFGWGIHDLQPQASSVEIVILMWERLLTWPCFRLGKSSNL